MQGKSAVATSQHHVGGRGGQVYGQAQRLTARTADWAYAAPARSGLVTLQRTMPAEIIEPVAQVRRTRLPRGQGELPACGIGRPVQSYAHVLQGGHRRGDLGDARAQGPGLRGVSHAQQGEQKQR